VRSTPSSVRATTLIGALVFAACGLAACGPSSTEPPSSPRPSSNGADAGDAAPRASVVAPRASVPPPAASQSDTPAGEAPTDPNANTNANREEPRKIAARHVLVQWIGTERAPASVVRSREQAFAVAQQVLKRAKAGEDFARLAIEFSNEPGAGSRGGSLGRFGRGQMVGAFEAAVFKLRVGDISDIVESPFGFHIIQRTE